MKKAFGGSFCGAVAAVVGLQGRVMWCDAEANLWQLSTREGVAETVRLCREANINTIAVDVKPLQGLVLYSSEIAPKLPDWNGKPYPKDYDLLQVMVEECGKAGISVYAALNVFSEGAQDRSDGPAYDNPDWQCVKYEVDSEGNPAFVRVVDSEAEHLAVFVNPAKPEPRAYELAVIEEIIRNYDVDGVMLDRMRYPNLYSDFSDFSRTQFEQWVGREVAHWPTDIIRVLPDGRVERGVLFSKWLEWRADVITTFLADVRRVVKGVRPDALVAAYVGSWYPEYYPMGVNWGSREYVPPYGWASKTYNRTGYAHLVDYMCTGCYYENVTRAEARALGMSEEASVEAAGETSLEVTMDDTFVYGSLYVRQYEGKRTEFARAVQACLDTTQGVMIFDLCHIRDFDWWSVLKEAFPSPAPPPHEVPGLAGEAKRLRRVVQGLETGKRT